MIGIAEDVDHVDGALDIAQRSHERLAEQALSDMTGIDRDHVVAAFAEVLECEIAGTDVDRRGADHGDRLDGVEDAADVVVVVSVVSHSLRTFGIARKITGPPMSDRASR